MLGADPQEYCDMTGVEQLESKVRQWRKECGDQADEQAGEQADLNARKLTFELLAARQCAERKNVVGSLHENCKQQIEEVETNAGCIGETCLPWLERTRKIAEDCDDRVLEGLYQKKADELARQLQERIDEADGLSELLWLAETCIETAEQVKETNAKKLFEKTLETLKEKKEAIMQYPEGSELEKGRIAALGSCEQAVFPAVKFMTDRLAKGLTEKKKSRSHSRWQRRYQQLERIRERVASIDAAFFVDSLELLDSTLKQADPDYEPAVAIKQLGDSDADDRRFLEKCQERCEQIGMNISRYERKLSAYQKKNNQSKSNAYAKKLEQEHQERAALQTEIDWAVEHTKIPAEQLQTILKQLAQAGCPSSAAR